MLVGHVPDTSQVLMNIKREKEKEHELESHSDLGYCFWPHQYGKGESYPHYKEPACLQ